jgi:endonuclease-3 related protein
MKAFLEEVYRRMFAAFGSQHWWPGDTPLEVAVGAILTQNTNWSNVERAIANLKRARALSVRRIHSMPTDELAGFIRPAGYFNVKARRLKAFIDFLAGRHRGSMSSLGKVGMPRLREALLDVHGIGQETADSIILYALERPVFVIDAYTKRILSRHGVLDQAQSYEAFQNLFHSSWSSGSGAKDEIASFYNEYHALFVRIGKDYCRPRNPACSACPLDGRLQ